ncbi:MAG: YceI family protein [Alphaproteobacteria bacterium]
MLKSLTLIAAAAIIGFSGSAFAQASTPYAEMPAGKYSLDETHASIIWKVSHLGLSNYAGRFTKFDADLNFDPAHPEKSTLTASIDPTSIETDYPYPEKKDFNAKLISGEKWFNAGEFPKIAFRSTKIEKTGETTGTMSGDLTFLGVTKPLSFDVTFNGAFAEQPFSKKPAIGFSAIGTMKRSDWGFGTYVPSIGDEVTIQIEAEFGMGKPEEKATEKPAETVEHTNKTEAAE